MASIDNNSAVSSLVVSTEERALQECKNNIAFVLRAGLFYFTASGIKSSTCSHRYNLVGGEIRRFNLRRNPNRKRDKIGVNQTLIQIWPFPPTLAPFIFICSSSSQ